MLCYLYLLFESALNFATIFFLSRKQHNCSNGLNELKWTKIEQINWSGPKCVEMDWIGLKWTEWTTMDRNAMLMNRSIITKNAMFK